MSTGEVGGGIWEQILNGKRFSPSKPTSTFLFLEFFSIVPELRQWCFILFLGKLNDFNVWYLLIWIFSKPLDEFIVLDFSNIVIKTEFI